MSIGGRIFLGVVLVQLLGAALILGWFFHWVRAELDQLTLQNAQEAVLRSIEQTQEQIRPAAVVAEAGARLLDGGVLGRERPALLERYFFEQLRLHSQLAGLFVGYPDGDFFYVMRSDEAGPDGIRTKVIETGTDGREVSLVWRDGSYAVARTQSDPEDSYDPRDRSWYRLATERDGLVWTEPYIFFSSQQPGITSAIAVETDAGQTTAVVGVDIEIADVSRFLNRIGLALGGSAFIVAPGGEVIAHSSGAPVLPGGTGADGELRFRTITELPGVDAGLGERILAQSSELAESGAPAVWQEDLGGRTHFIALGRMPGIDWPWLVVVLVPEQGLVEAAGANDLVLIGVVLLATALACALGYALSRSIGRPLGALHRNARQARQGNVELMEEIQTGYREIAETDAVLKELATQKRRDGTAAAAGPGSPAPSGDRT